MGFKFPGARVDPAQWSIKEWKQVATLYTVRDILVCPTPCFLISVFMQGDSSDDGTFQLINGHNVNGEVKYVPRTPPQSSLFIDFSVPVYFSRGMFLDMINKVDSVTVQYLPWSP